MELSIKISTNSNCTLNILDETPISNTGYLSNNVIVKNRFQYKDTISIDILVTNKVNSTSIDQSVFSIRKDVRESVSIPINFDGWFTIYHVVVPTKQWVLNSELGLYDTVYYSDGTHVYKYKNEKSTIVDLNEIINRNLEGTTISLIKKDYVSVCYLKKCYINLCQQLFQQNVIAECSAEKTNCELIFQRDLLWMTLNVIQYLTEFNQLAEAQRMIEQISGGCNGLCKQYLESPKRGCGCS